MKPKFVLEKSKDKKFYFTLRAKNDKVIATSETYNSKRAMLQGIDSVKLNAPIAEIVDETKKK